jgi:Mrp family chromosome partitioning ATPase
LGLPTLGLVPRVDELAEGERPHRYLAARPLSAYAEAVRAIHTSLGLANVDSPPKVVLVASSLRGEGRTTLAASLAAFAAREGSGRVLLMTDRDQPGPAHGSGEVVGRDEDAGLDCLPLERRAVDPPDLLRRHATRRLVAELRAAYDYVVIDSPPLLGTADLPVSPALADAALLVVRWEATGRAAAADGLARLRDAGASVAGAVLTRIDVVRHARYGYGDLDEYYGKYAKYHDS